MNVLIIGGGGREHALAWKAAQSRQVNTVYCAPGNAGTALEPKIKNVDISASDTRALIEFAKNNDVGLTIVGPEGPLVTGVVDAFNAAGLACFGPQQKAAALEGSKAYMKSFLQRHDIPTAKYASFTEVSEALAYLAQQPLPIVIKADGLAAGKGVVIAEDRATAINTVTDMLSGDAFGEAGKCVVIEEFLVGEEASFIIMTDGKTVIPFASSQDHKARDDGDKGPNTGGMGAYSPAPIVDQAMHDKIISAVIEPTLRGLSEDGNPYTGFLYAGIMITPAGIPKVLEFNCRFGDPETQPIMMRLRSDLVAACLAVLEGHADEVTLQWDPRAALGVVMASGGYPNEITTGFAISGLDKKIDDTHVFHAGTRFDDGEIRNSGGRVLCVVGLGSNVSEAQQKAYQRLQCIHWQDAYFRRDIGYRAIAREQNESTVTTNKP